MKKDRGKSIEHRTDLKIVYLLQKYYYCILTAELYLNMDISGLLIVFVSNGK
jgi:hypothetical protein